MMATVKSKNAYASTLCTASAILASKLVLIHLATVRSRFMSGELVQPQDKDGVLNPILSKLLLCFGSDFGGAKFVETTERLAKNCAENEPFFMILAALCGMTGAVPSCIGSPLVKTYTAARVAHSGIALLGDKLNTSFRSSAWIAGSGCTLAMAGFALFGSSKKNCHGSK